MLSYSARIRLLAGRCPIPKSARQVTVETPNASPLETYRVPVAEAWIDYNGHMNEGYYGVAFGDASDAYLLQRGFDEEYRRDVGGTFYTVETHIRYLRELKLADDLLFRTTVLGVDAKKLHLFHSMVHENAGYEAATQEVFLLHVSLGDVGVTASVTRPCRPTPRNRPNALWA